MSWEAIIRKKENITATTPAGWIGASTLAKLSSIQTQAGQIGTSTQATPHVSNETTQSGRIGTSTRTKHRAMEAEKKHSRYD